VKRQRVANKTRVEARSQAQRDYSWLIIFAAVFIAYLPALNGGVLWDDLSHITVPELRSVGGLWRIWTEIGATQQYYPLLHTAFWLEHRLWGDSMLGYHLANLALHATAAVLVVFVVRQLTLPGALLAGLIFALHPVCVESVAWISEQKNTLSAVFYLASALVYLRFASSSHSPVAQPFKAVSYWLAFALFICALLTKTVTATLPAALLLVFWWKRGRIEWRDVLPLVPWFVAAAAGGALTAWFEHQVIGAKGEAFVLTPVERILLAGRVILFYLGKLFWPGNLIFVYPRWTIDASIWWLYLYPAGALGLAIALAAMGGRGPLAGYLFFCGTLVPVLGFVNVYPFLFSYVADHFQYLASLGIIVPIGSGLTLASQHLASWQGRALKGASAVIVLILAVLTWNRSAAYQNVETLFRDTIARNPQAWMAYQNLGTELAAQNRLPEAIEAYEGALRARPGYVGAKNNLVLARMRLGDALADKPDRSHTAMANYEAVLRLEPDHFRAHYNLGTLLMDVPGRHAEAIAHLEQAVKIQPKSVEAQVNLGIALSEIPSRSREASALLEAALAAKPDLPVRELLQRLRADSGASRSRSPR
jgi:protein O-mannosyl-transferase